MTMAKFQRLEVFAAVSLMAAAGMLVLAGRARGAAEPSAIPYVATRGDAVRDMLWMAQVGTNDVVDDLGSGDGRIPIAAVREFGARRAVGIENDPGRVRESRANAEKAGVADRVTFIEGDLFTNDFRQATVLSLFLGHEPNLRLRPKIFAQLAPGARVVSHQFGMGEWASDKDTITRTKALGMWSETGNPYKTDSAVPDYTANESHYGTSERLMMWVVPAPVAGVWRGSIQGARGPREIRLTLHQRLSSATGEFADPADTNFLGSFRADLWGDHVRFEGNGGSSAYGQCQVRFDGHVRGDLLRGTLAVFDRGQNVETTWEARREPVDCAGTWTWQGLNGNRPVALSIAKQNGLPVATYRDGSNTVAVTDLYDHGGGFYFTLMHGREGNGLRVTEETGWTVGEAVAERDSLVGTIEFHPYPEDRPTFPGIAAQKPRSSDIIKANWLPRTVKDVTP